MYFYYDGHVSSARPLRRLGYTWNCWRNKKERVSGHMTYERERKQQAPKMKAWHGIDDEWVKHNNNNKTKKGRDPFKWAWAWAWAGSYLQC